MSEPPPPPPGYSIQPPQPLPPAKRGFFDDLKGLSWWQYLLVILPLTALLIGGLIGGVLGGLGGLGNLRIARSGMPTVAKVFLMLGVAVVVYVVLFIVAGILYAVTHRSG